MPSHEDALQFCIMIQAGLPASHAIRYFSESDDAAELGQMLAQWLRSRTVRAAQRQLMGKSWQEMNLTEKITHALELHYAQLAYELFSKHYAEVNSTDLQKLNTARQALEAKQAGLAGKGDAMSRFLDDFVQGRLSAKMNVGTQTISNAGPQAH